MQDNIDKELLDYFHGDDLAASTWKNKYAAEGESTPDDMHHRLAREFSRIEAKYFNPGVSRNLINRELALRVLNQEDIYQLFKDFRYIIPGGSVMSVLGTDKLASLSNCTVIPSPKDSISSIMDTARDAANLFKRRAGVGFDLSKLRPSRAKVNNSAKTSTGPVSFMDFYSNVTTTIAQEGRRGALMLTMQVEHPDILEFIEKKQDLTKVTGANISVMVSNEFMKCVEKDSDFILRWPSTAIIPEHIVQNAKYNDLMEYKKVYFRKVKARDIWNRLIHCAWRTAEPGILFWDNVIDKSPEKNYKYLQPISTNPCQPAWAEVLTPDGIRKIGDINIGDTVWTETGWSKVIDKGSNGIKPVYKYITSAGYFIGTSNHRVISSGKKIEAVFAKSIDSLVGNVEEVNAFIPNYILTGLYIGQGASYKESDNLITLNLYKKQWFFDEETEKILQEYTSKDSSCKFKIALTAEVSRIDWKKQVPDLIYFGTYQARVSFLRGLFSANGDVEDNEIVLRLNSEIMFNQVQIMLSSLGIHSRKNIELHWDNSLSKESFSYVLTISTDIEAFLNTIGFVQKDKIEKLKILNDTYSSTAVKKSDLIFKTEHLGEEEVFYITVDNNTHTYWTGGLNVTNCGEQPLSDYDSCRLMHINLTSFVSNPFTEKAEFDFRKLYEVSYLAMRLADDLVDLEVEYLSRIAMQAESSEANMLRQFISKAMGGRRTGLGFTGLADAVAMMGLTLYDTWFIEKIMQTLYSGELDSSLDMAALRDPFEFYDAARENPVFVDSLNIEQFSVLHESGRRNVSFNTVAPTGSVSLLAGCSSGIEPVFLPFYTRRRKVIDGEVPDYTDITGQGFKEFKVIHPGLLKFMQIHGIDDPDLAFLESPYYDNTAMELPSLLRVELQGLVQKYITSAISSTVNLPEDTDEKTVSELYMHAWKEGLKGITVYRENSREGILIRKPKPEQIPVTSAPKRPEVLEADCYPVKVKGNSFFVIVGLYKGVPYEVFTCRNTDNRDIPEHRGRVTKVRKMHYSFDSEHLHIDNLNAEDTEERAATLYSSMLMRHGVDIKYIIKTARKVNDNIVSFSSAMCRILSKYIASGDSGEQCPECGASLIRTAGCLSCPNCGYSKCMFIKTLRI